MQTKHVASWLHFMQSFMACGMLLLFLVQCLFSKLCCHYQLSSLDFYARSLTVGWMGCTQIVCPTYEGPFVFQVPLLWFACANKGNLNSNWLLDAMGIQVCQGKALRPVFKWHNSLISELCAGLHSCWNLWLVLRSVLPSTTSFFVAGCWRHHLASWPTEAWRVAE